jgi:beta-N-acetylhexosaminidase
MLQQIIGQHFFIGISGKTLTEDEKKFIVHNNIGGVVLFSRNVESPEQIRKLCEELQGLRSKMLDRAPLFIAIDMEGGRVARLKPPFTQWPPVKLLGDMDSPTVAFHMAHAMGRELRAVGINLDFAPCIDIFTNPKNTVIGDRSPSTDPEIVAKIGSALVRGYIKANVVPCVKHFPGHGNTLVDSHEDLPVEEADLQRLNEIELIPFKKTFKSRAEMVMTAHILFKNVDPDWPVTLSEKFLKKILREDCKYRGLVITDDLDMKAMSKHYDKAKIPVRAYQAGADILLYCNEPDSPPVAIEGMVEAVAQGAISKDDLMKSHARLLEFKKEHLQKPEPLTLHEATQIIGSSEHFKLSQAIAAKEAPTDLQAMN